MAAPPTLFIVCSDQPGNGKTLLTRVLVDFLLAEGHDPFCFDLDHPDGALRAFFPGRTALVDFSHAGGQAKVFDIIFARGGRDYVIDLPARHLARFCEAAASTALGHEANAMGFRTAVIYVVDREDASLRTAIAVEDILQPDLFVPAANRFFGSALPEGFPGPALMAQELRPDLLALVTNRRFSLRPFLAGDEADVPLSVRSGLKTFLQGLLPGLRAFEPGLTEDETHHAAGA